MSEMRTRPLVHYLRLFVRRWPLFVVVIAVMLALGGTLILSLPVRYVSQAFLLLHVQNQPEGFAHGESEATHLLRRIEAHALSADRIAAIARARSVFPEEEDPVERMTSRLALQPVTDGPLAFHTDRTRLGVAVSFAHADREIAREVVDDLVAAFLYGERMVRVGELEQAVDLVRREYEELRRSLGGIEAEIAAAVRRHADILPERIEARLAEIERLAEQVSEADEEMAALADDRRLLQFEYVTRRERAPSAAMEDRLETLRAQFAALASVASDRHPQVRSLREQIEALERQMSGEPRRGNEGVLEGAARDDTIESAAQTGPREAVAPNVAPDIALIAERSRVAEERIRHLGDRRDRLAERLASLRLLVEEAPEVARTMRDLQRRRDAVQRQLVYVGDHLATGELRLRIARDDRTSQLSALGPASLPEAPTGRRNLFFALLIVASLCAGAVVVVASDLVDGRVREVYDLQGLGAVPVVLLPTVATRRVKRKRALRLAATLVVGAAVAAATLHQGPTVMEMWGDAIASLSAVLDSRTS